MVKIKQNISKIGLIGHSEEGLIAPMVAAESKDVSFVILLAGPGVPGDTGQIAWIGETGRRGRTFYRMKLPA